MFNLKNAFGKAKRTVVQAVSTPKDPQVIIAEIHAEFDTASERLLKEAKEVLGGSYNIEKGKRLAAAGFSLVPEAVQAKEVEQKMVQLKEVAELVDYYQVNYPNNKFITEAQVKSICKKYGLVCADISQYKGFVPEKQLSLIENFKLRDDDKIKRTNIDDYYERAMRLAGMQMFARSAAPSYDRMPEEIRHYSITPALKICAPKKDIEVFSHQEIRGYEVKNIPDPIVLQPVKGGYLVVAKWGPEAEEEGLVNEKMN